MQRHSERKAFQLLLLCLWERVLRILIIVRENETQGPGLVGDGDDYSKRNLLQRQKACVLEAYDSPRHPTHSFLHLSFT